MRSRVLTVAATAVCLVLPSVAAADDIRVQSTTDTVDAGLVEGLLRGAYAQAQPGDNLLYTAVGTGAALTNARNGQADVVITHAPSLEDQFVQDGFSLGLGRQIFYSDYVIVGPTSDPAGVLSAAPHDAVSAYEAIANAADANPGTISFKSRADNSGTNVQEQIIWGLSNVAKHTAANASGNAARFEPGATAPGPAWYSRTNKGQADNLTETDACTCYTMVDRGTFNRLLNAGTITHLKIVSQKNVPEARGGENLLINPFSVYIVNPAKFPNGPVPNVAAATRFADFLTSASFQQALLGFPSALDPAFLPDAFPNVAVTAPLPQAVQEGAAITIAGTAANRLPGGGPVGGLTVDLQRSTDNGATWTSAGFAISVPDGGWAITSVVPSSARYRLATNAAPASSYNQYSPSTIDLGAVTATPTAGPPTAKPDKTKPTVSKVVLGRRGIQLRLSEKGTVKAIIEKRVRRAGKLRFVKVQTVTLKSTSTRAKTIRAHHKKLTAGRYRVRITATDAARNKRTLTRSFTIR